MSAQSNFAGNSFRVVLKESKENLYAVRGSVWAVVSAIVLSLMSYLLLTDAELSLLDQSEMLNIVASLAVSLGLLVSGILAGDSVAGERERATLEGLLLTPVGRGPLVLGKIGAVLAAWLLVFVIATPYILVVGSGTGLSGPALVYTFLLGTLCVAGFTALTVGISCLASSGRSATLAALAIFIAMATPTLLGTVLQNSWFGAIYNALSPFAQVRLSLDSVIVDKEGLVVQLPHLGALAAFVVLAGAFAAIIPRRISLDGGE
ncbi:MAG: ABC transporter permease subunit [Actinobacteria bacterium]|nr:ABC transporter permease subunit [Actinomycetota bacterium]